MSFWKYQPNDPNSKSLDGVGSGTGKAISYANYEKVQYLVRTSAGVTAGTVLIESAHDPAFAGTWNQVASVSTTAADAETGATVDAPPGGYLRARISVAITGGTVTVYLNAIKDET